MTEKKLVAPGSGMNPMAMKLFATWEVDKTPSNCVSRLCSLSLTKLIIHKMLGTNLNSIVIAVKMQGLKKVLRSNEIPLSDSGLLETDLQLSFCLLYPHFVKTGNKLHVMLQKKRYKRRTIWGYRTIAEEVINMAQILQKESNMELHLAGLLKEAKTHDNVVAKLIVGSLSSQPMLPEVKKCCSEEEELSSIDEATDSETLTEENLRRHGRKLRIPSERQRNLKQRFASLLGRFRMNGDLGDLAAGREVVRTLSRNGLGPAEIEEFFEEFDTLSDLCDITSEPDMSSVASRPKPSLRPFFSSSRSIFTHDTYRYPSDTKL